MENHSGQIVMLENQNCLQDSRHSTMGIQDQPSMDGLAGPATYIHANYLNFNHQQQYLLHQNHHQNQNSSQDFQASYEVNHTNNQYEYTSNVLDTTAVAAVAVVASTRSSPNIFNASEQPTALNNSYYLNPGGAQQSYPNLVSCQGTNEYYYSAQTANYQEQNQQLIQDGSNNYEPPPVSECTRRSHREYFSGSYEATVKLEPSKYQSAEQANFLAHQITRIEAQSTTNETIIKSVPRASADIAAEKAAQQAYYMTPTSTTAAADGDSLQQQHQFHNQSQQPLAGAHQQAGFRRLATPSGGQPQAAPKRHQMNRLRTIRSPAHSSFTLITRRKNATREKTVVLKDWFEVNNSNPYPSKAEKIMLSALSTMSPTQVSTWFANARRRMKKENRAHWIKSGASSEEATSGAGQAPTSAGIESSRSRLHRFMDKYQKYPEKHDTINQLMNLNQFQIRPQLDSTGSANSHATDRVAGSSSSSVATTSSESLCRSAAAVLAQGLNDLKRNLNEDGNRAKRKVARVESAPDDVS